MSKYVHNEKEKCSCGNNIYSGMYCFECFELEMKILREMAEAAKKINKRNKR